MNLYEILKNPQHIANVFANYIRAAITIIIWFVIAIVSLCIACVAIRGVWHVLNIILKSLGI